MPARVRPAAPSARGARHRRRSTRAVGGDRLQRRLTTGHSRARTVSTIPRPRAGSDDRRASPLCECTIPAPALPVRPARVADGQRVLAGDPLQFDHAFTVPAHAREPRLGRSNASGASCVSCPKRRSLLPRRCPPAAAANKALASPFNASLSPSVLPAAKIDRFIVSLTLESCGVEGAGKSLAVPEK